jgi:hypothetical protein
MTTAEKCEAILRQIIKKTADTYFEEHEAALLGPDPVDNLPDPCEMMIGFGPDWGAVGALTIYIRDTHYHTGGKFERVIDDLYEDVMKDEFWRKRHAGNNTGDANGPLDPDGQPEGQ